MWQWCELTRLFPIFTGRVIATFACSGEKEVNLAVQDAKAAFQIWRKKSGMERGRVLLEAARIIRVCCRSFSSRRVLVQCSEGSGDELQLDFGALLGYVKSKSIFSEIKKRFHLPTVVYKKTSFLAVIPVWILPLCHVSSAGFSFPSLFVL